ncbi:DegT/DnrJ/EryC1/StrS family aminotransferase [Bacillus cereus]
MDIDVPFFSNKQSFLSQWDEISELLDSLVLDGEFINGTMVKKFESSIQTYTNAKHAIAVNNASDALQIILKASGIKAGDEVIVPCYTFFASASSIANIGATPVFVDIDPLTYNICPEKIEQKITAKTKAIMPVHLFTQMADMQKIKEIAHKYHLTILEDSAEGIGMWTEGIHAGLHGQAGVLSFFPTKTLGAIGDAGMILTNSDDFAEKCKAIRHHGQIHNNKYIHNIIGFNSRMDDIQAAVLEVRLKYLSDDIKRRNYLAGLYDKHLEEMYPFVKTPVISQNTYSFNHVYYVYLIQAENRDRLAKYMMEHCIGTEAYYPYPLHMQPCFDYLNYNLGDFPNAEKASLHALGLPLYPDLTEKEIGYVCNVIKGFYAGGGYK